LKRNAGFARQLRRYYGVYTLTFALFVLLLAIGESMGLSQQVIGHVFLFVTIAIYATIGVMSRTSDVSEYYVAGRRVPAIFNGMATAADWMSAASFIGLAGTLYFSGFEGLAFVTGWTGGFVLVALLLAPTCASSANTRFRIFSARATRATSRAWSGSRRRCWRASCIWWRRSTAWGW
jgi:Predicted symporter